LALGIGTTVDSHSENEDSLESAPLGGHDSAQYRPALHRFLVNRLQNAQDAQDLAQEAYLRFYQLGDSHKIERPSSYLYRIAVNLVYEFRLRQRRDRVTYDSEMIAALGERTADPTSADPGDRLAEAEQVNRLLSSIPVAYRKVLIMHRRDGLSTQDIAKTLNLSRRTVEAYLAKAIAFARNARWDKDGPQS
jgi:RNA polymerase sigma factor (sigma-70 family)